MPPWYALNFHICINGTGCGAPCPIKCNGKCVGNVDECAPVCDPLLAPFLCSDGSCADSPLNCPNNCGSPCWDGSCEGDCPPVPSCGISRARCQDATCTNDTATCRVVVCGGLLCPDGSCSLTGVCGQYNGCPIGAYTCVDGTCQINSANCLCANGKEKCYDGTCSDICPPAPLIVKPTPLVADIDPSTNTTIPIPSDDGNVIATLTFLQGSLGQLTQLTVTGVSDSTLRNTTLLGSLADPATFILTSPLQISLSGDITGTLATIEFQVNTTTLPSEICLGILNTNTNVWDCDNSPLTVGPDSIAVTTPNIDNTLAIIVSPPPLITSAPTQATHNTKATTPAQTSNKGENGSSTLTGSSLLFVILFFISLFEF